MKHYYAGYNSYGIKTSNCWRIKSFDSAAARDKYVETDPSDQPTRETITAKRARYLLSSGNASADDDTMANLGFDYR